MMTTLPYLRNSERAAFKRCILQWWWAYRWGLKKKIMSPDARWMGTGIHLALAEYYPPGLKRGRNPVETWLEFCGESVAFVRDNRLGDSEQSEWVDARELGVAMLTGYMEKWEGDPGWEVIEPEYAFSVLIGIDPPVVNLVGTFDGVIRDHGDNGKIKLMEHKTAASISTGHLALDEQAGTYWAVATHELRTQGKIGPKEHLDGIEYNFLRKGMPDDRPKDPQGFATNMPQKKDYAAALTGVGAWTEKNLMKQTLGVLAGIAADNKIVVLGERSKKQPPPLFLRQTVHRTAASRRIQLQRIQDDVEHMTAVRSGQLPVTKTPTKECAFCDFREMCELQEEGGDWEYYKRFAYTTQDPYADHRDGAVSSKFMKER